MDDRQAAIDIADAISCATGDVNVAKVWFNDSGFVVLRRGEVEHDIP